MRLLVQITKNDLLSLFRNAPYWSQTPYLLFCVGLLISPLSTHAQVNECSIVEVTQLTISQDPIIKQQLLQVEAQKANFQTARSIFDRTVTSDLTWMRARRSPLLVEDASTIYSLNKVINTDWIYQAGISQLFESGLVVSPNLAFSRNSTSFPEDDFGNSQPNGSASNFFVLGLNATQPLLRGRGESITTANQRANQYQIETVDEVSRFTATTQVYSTAIAYWEYVAATKSLEIFKANENRTRRILEVTEILVEAQRKPAADTTQIQADVAEKTTLRINAEQQLFATRQNLGRTIGLEAEEAVLLPLPQDDFPNVNTSGVNGQSASLNDLIDLALVNRHDLKALSHQTTTNTIIRDAAEHNLQPQLDAQLSLGYGGRQNGKGVGQIFTPIYQNEGRNFALGATLSYTFPLENNAAKGNYANTLAIYDQQITVQDNQIRNIKHDVSIALNQLQISQKALAEAQTAYQKYQRAFSDEQEKFQNGLTTLINLILFQERLTFAHLNFIEAQKQFALAIANLRYQTGTLVPENVFDENLELERSNFYSIPVIGG